MTGTPEPASLNVDYFDGRSARARPVQISLGNGRLSIAGEGVDTEVAAADVRWPERTRHAARIAHLAGGGALQARDAAAWDAWTTAAGLRESLVVRAQQSWRGVLAAVVVLIAAGLVGYRWGLPWLAQGLLTVVPASADRALGRAARDALDGRLLRPSATPAARQQQIRSVFAAAVQLGDRHPPAYTLQFVTSPPLPGSPPRTRLGANAFALPGGTIFVTDELLDLLRGRDDVLIGVLGHELGHVEQRHGMRLLVQATALGAVSSAVWGDFSALFATLPVLYGQSAYSRDFEREADATAIALLRANRIPPAVMVELFERLAAQRAADPSGRQGFDLGIGLASHPDDAERIQAFRDAGR